MEVLGQRLAGVLVPPLVIGLAGPLGAGKTTLVRAILRGLGHAGPVRSPTYTLLESYALATLVVHHLDLYRIADPEELELLGIRDLDSPDAVWLVEWPERGGDRLPLLDWRLAIDYEGTGRVVSGLPEELRNVESDFSRG
jgi:tRNA threonylcarbamoyladenosine biosynthesis protein TsaE